MKSQCSTCGVQYAITGPLRGKTLKCPKCGTEIVVPDDFREYKVLSQRKPCGDGNFDAEKIERELNRLSLKGWHVVGAATCNVFEFSVAGHRNEAMIILERG